LRDPNITTIFLGHPKFSRNQGVNTESVYFGIIGGPTLGFPEPRNVMKKIFGVKYKDPIKFCCWEITFSSIFKNIFTPKKTLF
jgi:hypothetical protein